MGGGCDHTGVWHLSYIYHQQCDLSGLDSANHRAAFINASNNDFLSTQAAAWESEAYEERDCPLL